MEEKEKRQSEYNIRIDLTAYIGSRIEKIAYEHGDEEDCVVIPIARNNLTWKPNNRVYSQMLMYRLFKPNCYGWTHYLRMTPNKAFVAALEKSGYSLPFTGNAIPSAEYLKHLKAAYNNTDSQKPTAATNSYGF